MSPQPGLNSTNFTTIGNNHLDSGLAVNKRNLVHIVLEPEGWSVLGRVCVWGGGGGGGGGDGQILSNIF